MSMMTRVEPAAVATAPRPEAPWWGGRGFVLFAAACAVLPLLWPALPPLVDLPGHVGRYRILSDSVWNGGGLLGRHWTVRWGLIGNLGVDLIVVALHPLLDVEPAARLVVTAIPLVTVLAMLWLAHEAHGRIPPTAGLALPLAYAFPFQLGFVNFCLAQAMALGGLALWLRLARTQPTAWRIAAFGPIACVTWLVHSFGWAMLVLFVFGAEWHLVRNAGRSVVGSAVRAGLSVAPMLVPVVFLAIGERMEGDTGDWLDLPAKAAWAACILRERWRPWDVAGVMLIACVLWAGVRSHRLSFAPLLGAPAAFGLLAFLFLPRLLSGGAYVDMRMLPAATAVALLALRTAPADAAAERWFARLSAGFLAARAAGTTIAFALYAAGQSAALAAVPALPEGGGVLVLVNEPGGATWGQPRLTHIAGLAIARRRVFNNEQWAMPGQQPIRPLHPRAAPLDRDPSQLVYPKDAEDITTDFDGAIRTFDRCTFDAVWTVGFGPGRARARDLRLAWTDGRSSVYLVNRRPTTACR